METKYPLNYTYCWHCIHNTLHCPECGTNECSCGCSKYDSIEVIDEQGNKTWKSGCTQDDWWKWVDEPYKLGLIPDYPTREETENILGYYERIVTNTRTEEESKFFFMTVYTLRRHRYLMKFAKMYGLSYYSFTTIYDAIHNFKDGEAEYDAYNTLLWEKEKYWPRRDRESGRLTQDQIRRTRKYI